MLGLNGSALPKSRISNSEDHEHELDLQEQLDGTEPSAQIKRSTRTNLSGARNLVRQPNSHRGTKPLLPRSLKEALQLASLLSKSKLIPKGFENPEACLVGILYGMEVGLSPIAALQRMAIIDGRPTIWGDAALALVEASGLLVKIEERIESDQAQAKTATCQVLRSGRSEPITRSFSIEDAKRAGLWQKPGPWSDYPDRMLMMRARAFALRDAFPDVLMGLYLREEFEGTGSRSLNSYGEEKQSDWEENAAAQTAVSNDYGMNNSKFNGSTKAQTASGQEDRGQSSHPYNPFEPNAHKQAQPTSTQSSIRRAPPPPSPMVIAALISTAEADTNLIGKGYASADPQQSANPSEPETDSFLNPSDTLELFDSALACAQDTETLEEIREEFNERLDRLDTEGLQEAGRIFLRHEKRIRVAEGVFTNNGKQPDEPLENEDEDSSEEITGRTAKESLSPHRTRRRFSIRPRKGLTLAELNARRKIDLLKYLPQANPQKDEADE
ncbi:MAG: recombinase RecT [Alphaproteobacteria bacterium]